MPGLTSDSVRHRLSESLPAELQGGESRLHSIRRRALRRRQRKVATAAVLGVAATSTVVGLALQPFPRAAQEVGVAASAQAMPSPWSDQVVTGPADGSRGWMLPDHGWLLPNVPYLVAQGTTQEGNWRVVATSLGADDPGCLVEYDGAVFDRFSSCFDLWPAGEPAQWDTWTSTTAPAVSVVLGAVGPDARSVRVSLEDGTQLVTDAVATPVSQDLRFFAIAVPTSSKVAEARGITAAGELSAPPPGLPWTADDCSESLPCPTRVPSKPRS